MTQTKVLVSSIPSLRSPKDVQQVREQLLKEQGGIDAITGLEIPPKQAVLDHCHESQFVRAVASRQSNAALGKLENVYARYLKWWYNGSLPDFLRQCAAYLEAEHPKRFYHPGWMKRVKTDFNKLSATQQDKVLVALGGQAKNNQANRKKEFQRLLKNKALGFEEIRDTLAKA